MGGAEGSREESGSVWPSFPHPPPGKSKAWFREPKLGSWQDGALVGLRDGVSEAGSPTLYGEGGISQQEA